jgi:hypothetical protein
MGYYIDLSLNEVKLAESKAAEGLKAIYEALKEDKKDHKWALEGFNEKWSPIMEAVEKGEKSPTEALCEALEEESFDLECTDGFIILAAWIGEKAHDEGILLDSLGNLFEAGGYAYGGGEQGERWDYRFLGGSYEYGYAGSACCVSMADRERVGAAFAVAEAVLAPESLAVLREALTRAEFLEDKSAESVA